MRRLWGTGLRTAAGCLLVAAAMLAVTPVTPAHGQPAMLSMDTMFWNFDSPNTWSEVGQFNFWYGTWEAGAYAAGGFGSYSVPYRVTDYNVWYGLILHDMGTGRYEEIVYIFSSDQ